MKPISIDASTKVVGIIGSREQVARSLSPVIHNAAFHALEMNWVYLPFPVESAHVARAMRGLAAAGVQGFNVTMPHKVTAASSVDRLEGAAASTGAVNTVQVQGEELIGHNTDGRGLVRFLERDLGVTVRGASVLVLGAGGVARSVVEALARAGAASFTLLARDASRAGELESLAGKAAVRIGSLSDEFSTAAAADLVVNATPVGQRNEEPLISVEALRPEAAVVDVVYQPPATRLIERARSRGLRASGGLGMLLHQAALAFEIWTGVEPPMEAMSAGALASLKAGALPAD